MSFLVACISFFWIGDFEFFIRCHLFQLLFKKHKKGRRRKKTIYLVSLIKHVTYYSFWSLIFLFTSQISSKTKKNKNKRRTNQRWKKEKVTCLVDGNQINCFFLPSSFFLLFEQEWNRWQRMKNSNSPIQKKECMQQEKTLKQRCRIHQLSPELNLKLKPCS